MKNWLSERKIYFETAAATTLSVMAITISVVQLRVSHKQNELLESQVAVAAAQAAPTFVVSRTAMPERKENEIADGPLVRVHNYGTPVVESYVTQKSFISALVYRPRESEGEYYTIPIERRYPTTVNLEAVQGLLYELYGLEENVSIEDIGEEVNKTSLPQGYYISLMLRDVFLIGYRDILGKDKEQYIELNQVSGQSIIQEDEGRQLYDLGFGFRRSVKKFGTLDEIEPKELFDELIRLDSDRRA